MKKFQFSLESLLGLRRQQEQDREIELGKAVRELSLIEEKLAAAQALGEAAFKVPALTLLEMQARERLWTKSISDIDALGEPRSEALNRVEVARLAYVDAHIACTALERLKDKRFAQWKNKLRKKEIRNLDEAAKMHLLKHHTAGGME